MILQAFGGPKAFLNVPIGLSNNKICALAWVGPSTSMVMVSNLESQK